MRTIKHLFVNMYTRLTLTPCFIANILFSVVTGDPGGTSARAGASVVGGTHRGSTRSSDYHKITAADQQGMWNI